jgi:hypothetical protein
MADYREISQQYAKEAIRTVILMNAGAAVALLSQAGELAREGLADRAEIAMLWWSAGAVLGVLIWLAAFTSTRYVDKSERELSSERRHILTSDRWMNAGIALLLLSLGCFAIGVVCLALSFGSIPLPRR